jgi:hypothetical protein
MVICKNCGEKLPETPLNGLCPKCGKPLEAALQLEPASEPKADDSDTKEIPFVAGGTYGMRMQPDRPIPLAGGPPPSSGPFLAPGSVNMNELIDLLKHRRIKVKLGILSGIKLGIGMMLAPVLLCAVLAGIVWLLTLTTDWDVAKDLWSRVQVVWNQTRAALDRIGRI